LAQPVHPPKVHHNKYNPSILEAVFRRQKAIMNDMVEEREEEEREKRRRASSS
jgi:hypothetical protein